MTPVRATRQATRVVRLVREPARRPTLAVRLFVAIALVIIAGVGTVLLVSLWVAPTVFHRHLAAAGVALDDVAAGHVEDGFALALVTGVGAGVSAATVVAVAVTVVVARRITRPVAVAAAAAQRLADGDYAARIPLPVMGPELAALADAMNALAVRLENVERHRQQLMIDVAHELRTPLASLEATVEAIADGVLPADEQTLVGLTEQTGRLSRLTSDLAAVSRSGEHAFTVQRRPVDATAVARAAAAAQAARYEAAGVALVAPRARPVVASADADRLTEILDQLLDNALRHCSPGDTVLLTVDPPTEGAGASSGPAAGVRITVADTGRGFAPEDTEMLFARFYRAHPTSTAGSGVGLTIARALAEAQGGTLSADSLGLGKGATFVLTLPAA